MPPAGKDATSMEAETPASSPRRQRWRRGVLGVVVLVVIVVLVAAKVYVGSLEEAPLALPTSAPAAPVGAIDGTWKVSTGSVAGFRIEQTVLFMTGVVVGRTHDVSGAFVVSGDEVVSGSVIIRLTTVTSGGRSQRQFALSLETVDHPTATFTLDRPVPLPPGFASGATGAAMATGRLTLRGVDREVTVSVSARRDGSRVEIVGSIPITLADWGIAGPGAYGPLASVADHGSAEFFLVLGRA